MNKKKKDKAPAALKVIRWIFPKLEKVAPGLAKRWFIHLFFSPINYPVPPKEQEVEKMAEKFSILVQGKKIQCYRWGGGPCVLVVHGWAGRATQFRKFIPVLNQAGYGVVGFDAPAHGRSEGKRVTILDFEETLKALLLKIGSPVGVIAHSFGGVACLYAEMNGVGIHKLINIASPTLGPEIIQSYLNGLNASASSGDALEQYVIETTGHRFEEFTACYAVQHLKRPIHLLLIHDEQDPEVSIQHPLALQQVYPAATLHRTHGLGHTRILKEDDVIQLCLRFIQQS